MHAYILIDGNNLGFAAQAGPPESGAEKQPVHALRGVLNRLAWLRRTYPTAVPVMLWDGNQVWRRTEYPEYKATRDQSPEQQAARAAWQQQRIRLQAVLTAVGMLQIGADQAEADDVAAWLAPTLSASGAVLLYTSDRDWWQLVAPRVVWRRATPPPLRVSYQDFAQQTGYRSPAAYRDAKLLMGETGSGSDNVPGVPGIGERLAQRLLVEFGSLAAIEAAHAAGQWPQDRYLRRIWPALATAQAHLARTRRLLDLSAAPRFPLRAVTRPAGPTEQAWVAQYQAALTLSPALQPAQREVTALLAA